ncbi:MAG: gamma-glutamyltransferase [Bryobacteraceae bacterium]
MTEGVEITCSRGAVATGPAEGARAGAAIFQRGGNAMDAAAAACLACAVMEPSAVDVGGYVLAAVVLEGGSGRVWSLDANSVAPAAAAEDMFRTIPVREGRPGINELEYGCSVENDANLYGPLSVAVPGFMGGVGILWQRWGRLPWAAIVDPARELVKQPLPWEAVREFVEFKRDAIARFPSTVAFMPQGSCWVRPDLERTLDRLAEAGWRDFYEGEIGRAIADYVQQQGGILTRADMAAFSPRVTEPCSGMYRGAQIHTAIPPNGGYSVLAALGESEAEDWAALAELLRRMWKARLAGTAPAGTSPYGTVHVAAADAEGNLVSATISQGGWFGSCLTVPDTGIILGHGMCRFDPHAGLPNSPGPRKRPLNNVCPLIIRMPDRDVAIGVRGGRRIVSVTVRMAQMITAGAGVYEAAAAPRLHTITGDPLEISADFDPEARRKLEAAGYRIEVPKEVAGAAHGAEFLRDSGIIKAGGNTWAAGV